MFTGIVEEVGVVHKIDGNKDGIEISIQAKKILDDLKVDDSVSCSGICLTVTDVNKNLFKVQLVEETLSRTTAKHWKNNSIINLERALLPSTRMGGHFVQGHIDCTLQIVKNIMRSYKRKNFTNTSYKKYIKSFLHCYLFNLRYKMILWI